MDKQRQVIWIEGKDVGRSLVLTIILMGAAVYGSWARSI